MHFTREPIVETVITPKEGFKLIIRNSRGSDSEEYSVNAIEVVSFGHSYFFRNKEKPKAFLLPLSEYEVIETRETRTVLKKPQTEKSIKIGAQSKLTDRAEETSAEDQPPADAETGKKKERKRTRKRKGKEKEPKKTEAASDNSEEKAEAKPEEGAQQENSDSPPPSQPRRTLLPPPTSLISEQISRYKDYLVSQGAIDSVDGSEGKKGKLKDVSKKSAKKETAFPPEEGVTSQPTSIEEEQRQMFLQDEDKHSDKVVDLPTTPSDNEKS